MTCWKKEKDPIKRKQLKELHERMGRSHDDEDLSEEKAKEIAVAYT